MNKALKTLKEKGIRITPQRIEVFRVILESKAHLSAEVIYEKIKNRLPAISLATVYNILEILREKGMVSEIRIQFDKSLYEERTDMHHHFLCRNCVKIYDIDNLCCEALKSRTVDGHSISSIQGYFYGVCKNCQGDR